MHTDSHNVVSSLMSHNTWVPRQVGVRMFNHCLVIMFLFLTYDLLTALINVGIINFIVSMVNTS